MEKRTRISRVLCFLISLTFVLSLFSGCGSQNAEKKSESTTSASTAVSEKTGDAASTEPLLEYSFYTAADQDVKSYSTDAVTPIIEKKFNIKVSRTMYNQGQTFKERFNQMAAANDLPDVISASAQDAMTAAASGMYAEVGDMIKQYMPNIMKWCPESSWGDALYQGKMYSIPAPWVNIMEDKIKDDIYTDPAQNWTMFTRESILKKLGYTFTPLKDIEKKINETGKKPTLDDYKLEPAIATPDDLYNLLKKIKELNLKVGDKTVIPFSTLWQFQIHIGSMFGAAGGWQYNPNKNEVTGFLGGDNTKEAFKFINKLYNEGLLDKDFEIQKPEQFQEKVASGRVAIGMGFLDPDKARAGLKSLDAEDELRPLLMPRKEGVYWTGIDHVSPVTFQLMVRKDFKDIPRLMKYFDWFLSDEAMDLVSWGPEELGLWEIKDGKKVFKDNELYDQLNSGIVKEGSKADVLYNKKGLDVNGANCKAFECAPKLVGYNSQDWRRSYPYKATNIYKYSYNLLSSQNLETKGYMLQGVDDVSNAAGGWCWGQFFQSKSPMLFAAKTDEEFNKNWDTLYKEFLDKGKYEEGKKVMLEAFKQRGLVKQ